MPGEQQILDQVMDRLGADRPQRDGGDRSHARHQESERLPRSRGTREQQNHSLFERMRAEGEGGGGGRTRPLAHEPSHPYQGLGHGDTADLGSGFRVGGLISGGSEG